jgi:hypothetical protein
MSRLWACDRCGSTAPGSQLLPSGWERVMVRAIPKVDGDVCRPCLHDLDQALQDWFKEAGAPDCTAASALEPEFKRGDVVKCIDTETVSEVETVRCRLGKFCHYIVDAVDTLGTLQLKDVPGWYRPERFIFVERAFAGPGDTPWPQGSVACADMGKAPRA